MKLLVATKETQGIRKNDFSFCNEGEIVKFSNECDREKIDGSCGCRRSMSGVVTSKATTTMKVIESQLTPTQLRAIIREALTREGWLGIMGPFEANLMIETDTTHLIRVASAFKINDVIEKRGNKFHVREPARLVPVTEVEFLRDITK